LPRCVCVCARGSWSVLLARTCGAWRLQHTISCVGFVARPPPAGSPRPLLVPRSQRLHNVTTRALDIRPGTGGFWRPSRARAILARNRASRRSGAARPRVVP
jgi:hypothetical protein